MNTGFIAIISSIAVLVSATTSPETSTSLMSGNGGITAVPILQNNLQTTPLPSTSSSSRITTSSPSTHSQKITGSATPTMTSLTPVNTPNKPNNTQITNTTKHNNQTNNITNTSNTHTPNINSSSQQSNGSGENTNQVPSVTKAPVNVPDTTIQQTTVFQCDCSKYLTISTASVSKQTETKATKPISALTSSIKTAFTTTTTPTLPPTSTKSAITSSKTTAALLASSSSQTILTKLATTTARTHTSSGNISTSIKSSSSPRNATTPTTKTTLTSMSLSINATSTTKTMLTSMSSSINATTPTTTLTSMSLSINATSTTKTMLTSMSSSINATTPTTKTTLTSMSLSINATSTTKTMLTSMSSSINATTPTTKTTLTSMSSSINATKSTTKTTITSTSSSTTTVSATPISIAPHSRRRRGVVKVEIDKIRTEEESIVYDDTNMFEIYCMDICGITMNGTTTVPPFTTTTERRTTTTPRHRSVDLSGKSVVLQLVIVVNDTFTPDMTNKSSTVYNDLANQYTTSLTAFYRDLLQQKFREIVILGFSNGSIKCNYSLEMNAPINESDANSTLQKLRDVNWNNASLTNLTVDENETATEQEFRLANDLVFLPANVCTNNEVVEWDNNGNAICKYKCDIPEYKGKCGDHGECSFTYGGISRCICKDGYSGELCKTPKPTTTTAKPTKPDAIALSKIDIIGIAAGIGGGLVLILLVALCCLCTRLNKAKKRDRFYGYMDNDKEFLHDENSRIENVPEYTNQGYQREEDELQMQRFEPEGKNVDYEPGQRQGPYEREDKAYRKVEEPEGGNVLIYQPKHLRGPMERQSGASKFDEVEERSRPYRMMDTDTTYKIRRPTVNSDKNVPYN